MVQILPAIPSFGSRLAEALGQATSGAIEGYQKRQLATKDAATMKQLENSALTPVEQFSLYSTLSPEKQKTLQPAFSALIKGTSKAQESATRREDLKNILPGVFAGQPSQGQPFQAPTQTQVPTPLMGALSAIAGASPEMMGQMQTPAQTALQPPSDIPTPQQIAALTLGGFPEEARIATQLRTTALADQRAREKEAAVQQRHAETTQQQKKQFEHRETADYAKKLQEAETRAGHTLGAIKDVRAALKTHKTGLTWENFFKSKFKGTFLENIALTPEGAIVESSIPTFLEGGRELFGQRLSDADLAVILGKTIGLGKDNETNEAILKFAEKSAKLAADKAKIARAITKANGGYRPIDFADQVEEQFQAKHGQDIDDAFRESFGPKHVHLKDQQGGDLWVPENEVQAVMEQFGAKPA